PVDEELARRIGVHRHAGIPCMRSYSRGTCDPVQREHVGWDHELSELQSEKSHVPLRLACPLSVTAADRKHLLYRELWLRQLTCAASHCIKQKGWRAKSGSTCASYLE